MKMRLRLDARKVVCVCVIDKTTGLRYDRLAATVRSDGRR